jgi:hypothetical protein
MRGIIAIVMDYNLPIMLETSNPIARRRLILISIILATIPCYCLGGIAVMLAPDASVTATPDSNSCPYSHEPLQILTSSPGVISATPSNTPTITPSPTGTFTPNSDAVRDGMTWTATLTPTSFIYFHAFIYTDCHIYADGNLYPNIQLYPGNAFLDAHAIHYPLPQSIT